MPDETLSDIYVRTVASRPSKPRHAITLVGCSDRDAIPPARHWVDDVDAIVFRRGTAAVVRDVHDGLRRLVVELADPFMSTEHGAMRRVDGRWLVESPRSKNGVVVAGRPTRCATIELGDVLEVGHCVFLVERVDYAPDGADIVLDPERPRPLLASFHPDLIAADAALLKVARSRIPVLMTGSTGVGKEVYARAVHDGSGRTGPFVAVNCGALSPSLLEAELFGHRRGAFSGATSDRPGFIRAAHEGTLFLDELTELSTAGQVALLRALQEKEVVPVGDTRPVAVDIRVCAASQRPLRDEVSAGRFRSDLYARLIGHELRLPTLHERRADLGYLVANLWRRLSDLPIAMTPAALRAIITYDWPRNIRELEHCLAAAIVLADGAPVDIAHFPPHIGATEVVATKPVAPIDASDDDDPELRDRLTAKLAEHSGNISAVARDLDKHREQIQRWIRRFGIDISLFRRG